LLSVVLDVAISVFSVATSLLSILTSLVKVPTLVFRDNMLLVAAPDCYNKVVICPLYVFCVV
jgi:hypothetical protein